MIYKPSTAYYGMPKYASRQNFSSNPEGDLNEMVMDRVSDLYEAGKKLGMDAEYTRVGVDVGNFVEDKEYFGASALDYGSEGVGPIRDVEMEVELPEGSIESRYSRAPAPVFRVEAEVPEDVVASLEEELDMNFRRTVPGMISSAAEYTSNRMSL